MEEEGLMKKAQNRAYNAFFSNEKMLPCLQTMWVTAGT
jgi:hypothetical protein